MWTHRTHDGYSLCAYSTGFLDWGLDIVSPGGRVVFSSPCYLSIESWGFNEIENSEYRQPWSDREWEKALEEQADALIEGVQE